SSARGRARHRRRAPSTTRIRSRRPRSPARLAGAGRDAPASVRRPLARPRSSGGAESRGGGSSVAHLAACDARAPEELVHGMRPEEVALPLAGARDELPTTRGTPLHVAADVVELAGEDAAVAAAVRLRAGHARMDPRREVVAH